MVQQLDITAMRRLVHSIITDHPGIVFDALDAMQAGDPNPPPPTPVTTPSGVSAADAETCRQTSKGYAVGYSTAFRKDP